MTDEFIKALEEFSKNVNVEVDEKKLPKDKLKTISKLFK
jgi:hypothetical protein